jgi:hypothetical protein
MTGGPYLMGNTRGPDQRSANLNPGDLSPADVVDEYSGSG